jgi:hypothetical protein
LFGIASGEQPIVACPEMRGVHLKLDLQQEAVTISNSLSLEEIRQLYDASGAKVAHQPFGLYTSTFYYRLEVDPSYPADCAVGSQVRVTMVLDSRRIFLGRELGDRPCLRDAALSHYWRHAGANTQALLALSQRLQKAVGDQELLKALQTAGPSMPAVERVLRPALDRQLPQFDAENRELHAAVDTPAEVHRLEDACHTPI